jgi:hypothetical protein
MSERMTSDELLETHCTVPIENVEPGTFAMRDWIGNKTNHWLTYRQCSEFLAHLRASQTPPQAVTREQMKAFCRARNKLSTNAEAENFADCVTDFLASLADKPAPTPTPMTEEEQRLLDDVRDANEDDPTCPVEPEDAMGLVAIIERLSSSPTAPKGEA